MRPLLLSSFIPAALLISSTFATSANAEADPELTKPETVVCGGEDQRAARIVGGDVGAINAIRGFDFAELVLVESKAPSIIIEGAPSVIADITVSADEGAVSFTRGACAASARSIRVTISSPSFEEISVVGPTRVRTLAAIRGAGDATIELDDAYGSDIAIRAGGEVVVFASGASRHHISVTADSVVAMHNGTGDITLSGKVRGASLSQRGLGAIFARSLEAIEEIIVESEGGNVFATR